MTRLTQTGHLPVIPRRGAPLDRLIRVRDHASVRRTGDGLHGCRSLAAARFHDACGGAAAAWPLVALAQKAGRTYRLGCLSPHPRDEPFNALFFGKLRRAGFIEGQNLTIDYRAFAAHLDLISQYAAELVIAQPDVIYAAGGAAVRAVQQATKSIPIVGITADMVGEGLVESFARPNGNTTGVSILALELEGKRQEILIEAVPGIRRMAALAEASTLTKANARALQEVARATSSFQSIASPEPRRLSRQSIRYRHRAPRRCMFFRPRCSTAMFR
jgi:hypothetical protein